MKKNTLKITIILAIIAVVCCFNNDIGYCATQAVHQVQPVAQNIPSNDLHKTIIRFLYAMGAVVLSSVLLYVGLSVYNKFFVNAKYSHLPEDEILKTPKTANDAIDFFIKKNKIN